MRNTLKCICYGSVCFLSSYHLNSLSLLFIREILLYIKLSHWVKPLNIYKWKLLITNLKKIKPVKNHWRTFFVSLRVNMIFHIFVSSWYRFSVDAEVYMEHKSSLAFTLLGRTLETPIRIWVFGFSLQLWVLWFAFKYFPFWRCIFVLMVAFCDKHTSYRCPTRINEQVSS